MADNRREDERIQILGELPGDATVHQSISVRELSRTGAQIESTFPLQLNSLHEFRLALGSQSVIVKGRDTAPLVWSATVSPSELATDIHALLKKKV